MKSRKTSLGHYQLSAVKVEIAIKLKKLNDEIKSLTTRVTKTSDYLPLELGYSIEMAWRQLREILASISLKGIGILDASTYETTIGE